MNALKNDESGFNLTNSEYGSNSNNNVQMYRINSIADNYSSPS